MAGRCGCEPQDRSERGRFGEEGFVAGSDGLVFGTLLFVIGTLLVAFAWGIVDTKMAAQAAARHAASAYVAASDASAALSAAGSAADSTLAGWGRAAAGSSVAVVSGSFARCERITVVVRCRAPLLDLPLVGMLGAGESVTGRDSQLVDPFVSGPAGTSACA